MKVEEIVSTIAKFFNDLIGTLVPGVVLAVGLAVMHLSPSQIQSAVKLGDTTGVALVTIGILFALGHVLVAVYEHGLKSLLGLVKPLSEFNEAEASKRQSFEWFAKLVKDQQAGSSATDWGYHDLRSVALSVSSEAADLGRRFMFISLLCNGVGAALFIITLDYATCKLLFPSLLYAHDQAAPWYIQVLLLAGAAFLLFKRGNVFYSRAMATPFSIAVAELKLKKAPNAGKPSP